jgi:hypothetical protein
LIMMSKKLASEGVMPTDCFPRVSKWGRGSWVTKTENADTRGDGNLTPGSIKLILDRQQRLLRRELTVVSP